jgi:hypothetical protein
MSVIAFTCLYVDDVRTSQEARHVTVIAFTCLYVDDVRTSLEARPVTGECFKYFRIFYSNRNTFRCRADV